MSDWKQFVDAVPWFLVGDERIVVSESSNGMHLSAAAASVFPQLAILLARATATPVLINEVKHQLLAWTSNDGYRMGWLCRHPYGSNRPSLCPDHEALAATFGGITERFNEPEGTWLLNHNEVLTGNEASRDASFVRDQYGWAFDKTGGDFPIEPSDYYSIACEANGNTTFCHRLDGNVILFAPDHSFDFVVPLSGCPEYTFYRFVSVGDLRDWVNAVARQWLSHID